MVKKKVGKKKSKRNKKNKLREVYVIIILFLIIFILAFFVSFRISKEKKIINYHNITFEKIKINGKTFYKVDFYDLGKDKYTYYFYYNPYELEKIKVEGNIKLKNETYVFADNLDKCKNFYPSAVSFSVFLFKLGTHPEVRSIDESKKEKYENKNYTIIYVLKTGKFGKERIEKKDNKYFLYIKNCNLEKIFERFLLKAYIDKKSK